RFGHGGPSRYVANRTASSEINPNRPSRPSAGDGPGPGRSWAGGHRPRGWACRWPWGSGRSWSRARWPSRGCERGWVENDEPRESSEVGRVEGEQPDDSVSSHGCDEPGVVGDATVTDVGHHQSFPFSKQRRSIREEAEQTLYPSDLNLTLGNRQPEPI